jgi:subtilisin-like proprotein convertase family protein
LISLIDPTVTEYWAVSGLTNTSGTATIRTHGNFVGAPSGVYKVILSKTEKTGEYDTISSTLPSQSVPLQIYSLIDTKDNNETTTPLKIIIEDKNVAETFEIGTAVRILIQTINPGNI